MAECTVVRNKNSGARLPGFELRLYTLLTAHTWASCLTSLCPSFICKVELIIRTLLDTWWILYVREHLIPPFSSPHHSSHSTYSMVVFLFCFVLMQFWSYSTNVDYWFPLPSEISGYNFLNSSQYLSSFEFFQHFGAFAQVGPPTWNTSPTTTIYSSKTGLTVAVLGKLFFENG